MLGLYECVLSTAIIFFDLLQNLFALCAELKGRAGVCGGVLTFLLKHVLGVNLAGFGHSGVNGEITPCYLSLFFVTNYNSKQR